MTVCGPPTLIPRDVERLGCEVRYDLDDLGEADVVYALRMQNERMGDAFVPSLREYVARYQIDGRRLEPRQLLMHPGPVNRGVELAAEVIDSPQALIVDQVASGLVVRMAILYELLSGGGARRRAAAARRCRPWSSRHERRRAFPRVRAQLRARRSAAGRRCSCGGARLLDPRAGIDGTHDLLVRDGAVAEIGAPGALDPPEGCEVVEGEGLHVLPGFVDPHVHLRTPGPRGRGGPRVRHARRGGRRLLLRARDAEHRPGRRQRLGAALAAGARRASRRSCRSAFWPRSRRASTARELTEMASSRARAPPASATTASRSPTPSVCARRSSTSGWRAACSRCTRRIRRSRGTA